MAEYPEWDWYSEKMGRETCKRLEDNGISTTWAPDRKAGLDAVLEAIRPGSVVGYGGSRTLVELGVLDRLRQGGYELLDRDKPGISPEERKAFQIRAMTADVFLSGVNGIAMTGQLFWIDGFGSRVGPILFGPEKVVLVAGINKVAPDRAQALYQAKNTASPLNAYRLQRKTPCAATGFCADCSSPDRICSYTVTMDKNPLPGRVQLILIGEKLGF